MPRLPPVPLQVSRESLLVHSLSVYALVNAVSPFTQIYSDADREVMRWAALLHDYGKTSANWQKAMRGPHRVSLGDVKYDELRSALEAGIACHSSDILTNGDVDDILVIIEFRLASAADPIPISGNDPDPVLKYPVSSRWDHISKSQTCSQNHDPHCRTQEISYLPDRSPISWPVFKCDAAKWRSMWNYFRVSPHALVRGILL